jgi:hypothetical protein
MNILWLFVIFTHHELMFLNDGVGQTSCFCPQEKTIHRHCARFIKLSHPREQWLKKYVYHISRLIYKLYASPALLQVHMVAFLVSITVQSKRVYARPPFCDSLLSKLKV